jgi:hypothetical protein
VDFVWGLRQTVATVTLDNLDSICIRASCPPLTPVQRAKAEKSYPSSVDVDHVDSNVSSSSHNSIPKSLKKRGQDIPGFIPPSRYGGASVPTTPVANCGRKSKGSDFNVDPSFVPPSRYGGCANPNAHKLKNLHVDIDVDAASVSTPTTRCDVLLYPVVMFPEKLRRAIRPYMTVAACEWFITHMQQLSMMARCVRKYGKEKTHTLPLTATLRMLVYTWCAVGLLLSLCCYRLFESCPAHCRTPLSVLLSSSGPSLFLQGMMRASHHV